jgi:hypothetical protein
MKDRADIAQRPRVRDECEDRREIAVEIERSNVHVRRA